MHSMHSHILRIFIKQIYRIHGIILMKTKYIKDTRLKYLIPKYQITTENNFSRVNLVRLGY